MFFNITKIRSNYHFSIMICIMPDMIKRSSQARMHIQIVQAYYSTMASVSIIHAIHKSVELGSTLASLSYDLHAQS